MTRHFHSVEGKSRTQQSDRESNDLNLMSAKHLGHRIKHGNPEGRQPQFGYVPSESYHEMLNRVTDMQNHFNRLPARTRAKFHNDPGQMLRFVEQKANYKEALKMGLIPPSDLMEAEIRAQEEQVGLVDESGLEGHVMPKADPEANPVPSKPVTKPKAVT